MNIALLILSLVVGSALPTLGNEAERVALRRLPITAPRAVTTLKVVAVTDTSLVLTWTEIASGNTTIARYLLRVSPSPLAWTAATDVLAGGCAAPVYGSNANGGRVRSCVLGGLQPNTQYQVQVVAYTGTLNISAVFGPLSNVAEATTAQRVGSLLVSRPRMFLDTVGSVRSVAVGNLGYWSWPMNVHFFVGDYPVTFRDSLDSAIAHGYLLVVKP